MTQELLPCPFCGGKAKSIIGINAIDKHIKFHKIYCTKCQNRTYEYDKANGAIEAWNTRIPPINKATINTDVWKVECKHCHGFTEIKREDAFAAFSIRTFGNVYDAIFPETELAKMVAELTEQRDKANSLLNEVFDYLKHDEKAVCPFCFKPNGVHVADCPYLKHFSDTQRGY